MRKIRCSYLIALLCGVVVLCQQPFQTAKAAVQRVKITSGSQYLIVEALNDDLIHFELSALGPGPSTSDPIYTSPMVHKTNYIGPISWSDTTAGDIRTLQTPNIKVDVNTSTLCATVTDKVRGLKLTTYCSPNLGTAWKSLTMTPETFTHGYGLGAEYVMSGTANGDWVSTPGHQVRNPGEFGNEMEEFDGGGVSNTQYPVLYLLGSGSNNYAMFLDNYYKQRWDFTADPWKVEMWGDWIRWYVMTGPDLPTLRKAYMELTGRPPVPPKKALGLWVSTFGYHNWDEIDTRLAGLKGVNFPLDGFVLDLYWFGGIKTNSPDTQIGSLIWDTVDDNQGGYFPNPASQLATYKNNDGVGIILIEESLVGKNLQSWIDLNNQGFLVRDGCLTCIPTLIDEDTDSTDNDFFGDVGIIDWTNTTGADWWFDNKRLALINDGVFGHWLDLNEPEGNSNKRLYDPDDWYAGFDPHVGVNPAGLHGEADIHNMFAFFQAQSIARGYTRNALIQRPFMMSRSGAPGIQRFGATQWSGDIAPKFTQLATWSNVQMMMTMSGMDYYSSDSGGFRRNGCNSFDCTEGFDQLYTQWYATGMMFDVPGRPHSDSLNKETSPASIGHVPSNFANTRRRYELIPYTYSLAHRAWLNGEPVVPPLVYYYQNDLNVRTMGHEKLLGRDLLAGIVAGYGEFKRDIYLPSGDWVSFDTNEWFHSTGHAFEGLPEYRDGIFRLPLFARAGAIIPTMYVDNQTGNALGFRRDGIPHNELIVRVYANPGLTDFTLYEDDGQTISYKTGANRTTVISQQKSSDINETVTIAASSGTYTGAPTTRNNVVTLAVENQQATAVTLNGSPLTEYTTKAAFDAANSGWWNAGYNLIQAKSGRQSVTTAKTFAFTLTSATVQTSVNFVCINGVTTDGQSVFVVGNIPQLGGWDAAKAIKLDPNVYPKWTGVIENLPPSTTIEWKCIKRNNNDNGNLVWEPDGSPDPNNTITTPGSGYGGSTTDGGF
jgi:alpha-glucosidase